MSQTAKTSKLTVRNRVPGALSTGMNTEVLLNGVPVPYVTFLKIEVKPKGIAKVTLELIGELDVDEDKLKK